MIDATDATFAEVAIERSKTVPVVVDLWAEWCGPCKTLGPILERVVAETDGQVELVKVDVDANPQVANAFRAQSIPAVHALVDGKVVDAFIGALPEAEVRAFVESLLPAARPRPTSCSTRATSSRCSPRGSSSRAARTSRSRSRPSSSTSAAPTRR